MNNFENRKEEKTDKSIQSHPECKIVNYSLGDAEIY